jgi:hypothetical protein
VNTSLFLEVVLSVASRESLAGAGLWRKRPEDEIWLHLMDEISIGPDCSFNILQRVATIIYNGDAFIWNISRGNKTVG